MLHAAEPLAEVNGARFAKSTSYSAENGVSGSYPRAIASSPLRCGAAMLVPRYAA